MPRKKEKNTYTKVATAVPARRCLGGPLHHFVVVLCHAARAKVAPVRQLTLRLRQPQLRRRLNLVGVC